MRGRSRWRAAAAAALVVATLAACTGGSTGRQSPARSTGANGRPSASGSPSGQASAAGSPSRGPALVERLQAAVQRTAGTRAGDVVVAVALPAEGLVAETGVETPVRAASTVKVLIYLARARRPMSAADADTARAMIQRSDNSATTRLWRAAGGTTAVAAEVTRLGLARTTPTTPLLEPWDGWLTTARDLTAELAQIVTSTAASDRTLVRLMEGVAADQRWGVGRVAPAGQVAVKNGWLPVPGHGWVVLTAGCVAPASAAPTCLAVTTTGNASYAAGVRLVDAVTAAAYAATAAGGA